MHGFIPVETVVVGDENPTWDGPPVHVNIVSPSYHELSCWVYWCIVFRWLGPLEPIWTVNRMILPLVCHLKIAPCYQYDCISLFIT